MKPSDIDCLLCQAKVAHNSYDLEDCLELIDEMAKALRQLHSSERFPFEAVGNWWLKAEWQ